MFSLLQNAGNYAFGYNEDHATGGTFRRESGNAAGQVVGSYGLRDIDGRVRTVNYVADDAGFRAAIATNEPGVEPKDPADVTINKATVVAPAATLVAAPAAPIAVAAPQQIIAAPAQQIVSQQVLAAPAPIVNYAPQYAPQYAPIAQYAAPVAQYAAAPLIAARPATFTTTTTTNHIAPAQQLIAAPQQLIAAPQQLVAAPQQLVAAPQQLIAAPTAQQVALNTYAHPAAWGYTLGLPQTFGYTVLKK